MKATSVTQIENTFIDLITQPLREKINEAGSKIHNFLIDGAIHQATETVRNLSVWFEDLIWKSYLNSLLQCKIFLLWLRTLGAQKGLRLISYQQIWITLPTGTKVRINSPFFVKARPRRGRKKRGPQNRGEHLFLSLMGFIDKVEPSLAFRAIKLAIVAPSGRIPLFPAMLLIMTNMNLPFVSNSSNDLLYNMTVA